MIGARRGGWQVSDSYLIFVFGVLAQLLEKSQTYASVESMLSLVPQVIATPPARSAQLDELFTKFKHGVKRCLQVVATMLWLCTTGVTQRLTPSIHRPLQTS